MNLNLDHLAAQIDLKRPHQQSVVRWALSRLIEQGQRGVVLADEVGCGKTYEALAILALLWRHNPKNLRRVLILATPTLLRKWHEEITANDTRPDSRHGLRPYLHDEQWQEFNQRFIERLNLIETSRRAYQMAQGTGDEDYFQGVLKDGHLQVPDGLFLVNRNLLYAGKRGSGMPKPLKYILKSRWDLVIVDEAHHYGKGNECDGLFAANYKRLGRGQRPNFSAQEVLQYQHILLLTATPFELDPNEMVNLLAIAGAQDDECQRLSQLLKDYQRGLSDFYNLRTLSPDNPRRTSAVAHLRQLREGLAGEEGVETILARWIVRNSKEMGRREYALITRKAAQDDDQWQTQSFDKFDDLKRQCAELPLIPFAGPHALAYLELRTLMQELTEQAQPENESRGTFIAMDLQQGLSSYQQLLAKADKNKARRLLERDTERARRLRQLLEGWIATDNVDLLHPKIQALGGVVRAIIRQEVARLEREPYAWFAKIVVFNKLVAGTAPYLNSYLQQQAIEPVLGEVLERMAGASHFQTISRLRDMARKIVNQATDLARDQLTADCLHRGEQHSEVLSLPIWTDAGFDFKQPMHAVEAFRPYFINRVGQTLFLIDFLRRAETSDGATTLQRYIQQSVIEPVVRELNELINRYFDSRPDEAEQQRLGVARFYETGVQRLSMLREHWRSPEVAARYDGESYEYRESNRMNFNDRWNPLVLIVSRVGEEGIDLQKQARYILHYDLEWNPAKMEQREGRVDREGYGHGNRPIDVRFFLLKGTYEERIFHTVMQRDQWFQILMGSQRRQLGTVGSIDDSDVEDTVGPDLVVDDDTYHSLGKLTSEEKEAVMIDLRPR